MHQQKGQSGFLLQQIAGIFASSGTARHRAQDYFSRNNIKPRDMQTGSTLYVSRQGFIFLCFAIRAAEKNKVDSTQSNLVLIT